MAGEKIGITYEALIKIALDRLKHENQLNGNVYWNETPSELTVEPDFIVGQDINTPAIIIMVTHSGSSKNSDMKCWRNIGELCEAKTVLAIQPTAINIVFDATMKNDLKRLQKAAFDGQLIIGDTEYGSGIVRWVSQNAENLPADKNEKVTRIVELSKSDTLLNSLICNLKDGILECIRHSASNVEQLWSMENARKKGIAPSNKETSIRRGISKLLIFDDLELAMRLYRNKKVAVDKVPPYAYSTGLAQRAIGGAKPADAEIMNAFSILSDSEIIALYQGISDNPYISNCTEQIRRSDTISFMSSYVCNNYYRLICADNLCGELKALRSDPDALIARKDFPANWPPHNVWLLDIIIEIIKASTGKSNGYGYAQLATDIAVGSTTERFSADVRDYLLSPWGHLSEWSTRSNGTPLPDEVLMCVAVVLSSKLREIGLEDIVILTAKITASFLHNLVENKLCTYRGFSPLPALMDYHGIIKAQNYVRIRTCFAEKAGLAGLSGKTTVAKCSNTIINWQTATDAGRDHKRKELCGRAIGLRYTWNAAKKRFEPRPGVQKLILLLDGTWRQKDLDALVRAGWDEIYYPDELDQLKKAIV